jgi:sugar phosphate isomerase/epimerase
LDDQAVAVIREIAAMAEQAQLRVALYPHVGFYVATVQDALRLVKKVDRENVGASFNLCHFLKLEDERELARRLQQAAPHLLIASINGADRGDTQSMGWDRLIQTLDRGDFDVTSLLQSLQRLGYRGPIGLQCYAIAGEPRENLARSMAAWREITSGLARDEP